MEDLIVTVEAALEEAMVQFEALVPYSEGHIINQVREEVCCRACARQIAPKHPCTENHAS